MIIGVLRESRPDETRVSATPATNFTVARVKRDILRRSFVGLIATRRSPSAGEQGNNEVFGVDADAVKPRAVAAKKPAAKARTSAATPRVSAQFKTASR